MVGMSFVFATQARRAESRARARCPSSRASRRARRSQRFTISFYLTAMLFIVFDIEIVFLYPLAVVLERVGWFGFWEFAFFLGILGVAYVYIWRKERSNGGEGRNASPRLRPQDSSGCSDAARARRLRAGARRTSSRLLLTTVEKAVAWAQSKSIWPDTFGLSCCAIEMMSIVSPRYDIARFGMEAFRSSPRQADLLIVSGRVAHKMAAPLRQIYDQMLEPKWVIAMGACASSGRDVQQLHRAPGRGQDRRRRRPRSRLPAASRRR